MNRKRWLNPQRLYRLWIALTLLGIALPIVTELGKFAARDFEGWKKFKKTNPSVERVVRDRNQLAMMCVAGCLWALGLGVLHAGNSLGALLACTAVWTFGEMLSAPIVMSWVAARADDRSRGRYMGAFTLCFSIAFVLAPLVGTAIYERAGPDWV